MKARMAKRKKKTQNVPIDKNAFEAIAKFILGTIGISEFMRLTGTNQSGCYSMISRGVRDLVSAGRVEVKMVTSL